MNKFWYLICDTGRLLIGVGSRGQGPQKIRGFRHLITVRWVYFDTSLFWESRRSLFFLSLFHFFLFLFNILFQKRVGGARGLRAPLFRGVLTWRPLNKHIFCLTVNLGICHFPTNGCLKKYNILKSEDKSRKNMSFINTGKSPVSN